MTYRSGMWQLLLIMTSMGLAQLLCFYFIDDLAINPSMDNPGQNEPQFRRLRATCPEKLSHLSDSKEPVVLFSFKMYVCTAFKVV